MEILQKVERFSFLPIVAALVLLVLALYMLILNEENHSKDLAINAFIILSIGVVWQFINHLNKDTLS